MKKSVLYVEFGEEAMEIGVEEREEDQKGLEETQIVHRRLGPVG